MAIAGNREYNIKRVVATLNGTPFSGASDDDWIVVSDIPETFLSTAGARGEVAVSRNSDRTATITISLWQGSFADRRLLEQAIAQQKNDDVGLAFPIMLVIKDLNTGEHIVARQCWIHQEPDRNFGVEQQAREYVFKTDELEIMPL